MTYYEWENEETYIVWHIISQDAKAMEYWADHISHIPRKRLAAKMRNCTILHEQGNIGDMYWSLLQSAFERINWDEIVEKIYTMNPDKIMMP